MKTTNTIVANALAVKGVAKNALDVTQQRKNDEDWKKFSAEAEKISIASQALKKELKSCENEIMACYAKIKPTFDKYEKFMNDTFDFRHGKLYENLHNDDRYELKIRKLGVKLNNECFSLSHIKEDALSKAWKITNLPH